GIPLQSAKNPCKPAVALSVDDPREVYLDYSATTPLRPEVAQSLTDFYGDAGLFGNPSSSHLPGKRAHEAVARARAAVAECLAVPADSIVFTGGGSESNNLAIKGLAFEWLRRRGARGHLITGKTEHASVLGAMRFLETLGFEVTYLDPTRDGIVTAESVRRALTRDTVLVSLMAVNNETGTVNPTAEVASACHERGALFMADAVQAFGKMPVKPQEWGVDLMSITGHKIYGPKGVGALYVRPGLALTPLVHGGEQEGGQRAGTENAAGIHAFGVAAGLAHRQLAAESVQVASLRDYFLSELRRVESGLVVVGGGADRVPHVLNVGFAGVDGGALLLSLNNIGVYVSAGSACAAGKGEVSHVIKAMGLDTGRYGTVRFSLGLKTTKEDIDYVLRYLPLILAKLRGR
ncbi:MAG: cysteine desulfurase, partial [Elusimicrobia bacterium]|nr:cysteine desulfurase [Elusimicrobiota bacterium]